MLAELGEGIRQLPERHRQGTLGEQAESLELLEYSLGQPVLDGLPLTGLLGTRKSGADNPFNAVGVRKLGNDRFRLTKGDVEPLAQWSKAAFQRHQALPKKAPPMIPHGLALQGTGRKPARIDHIEAEQHVGLRGRQQRSVVVQAKIPRKPVKRAQRKSSSLGICQL